MRNLFISLLLISACASPVPVTPVDPGDNPLPPKGEIVNMEFPAGIEQCMVQPETYICQQECLSIRAEIRAWCVEGYVFDPSTFEPESQ